MSRWRTYISILLTGLLFAGHAAAQTTGKNPVIIIPGITGSQLINPATKSTVWFSVRRDSNDDLRLPMRSADLKNNVDGLVVGDIIRSIELPVLPDVEVYKELIDALKERGYSEATWESPTATDVFYVFPYDWRRDNVESAHLLMSRMAAVKQTLKQPDLKFDILAHSMGGLIARYAAMYGTADLPREGKRPVPTWAGAAHVNKLMMFGTPNEGSFRSFEAILNGYPVIADRKLPFVDDMRSEDVFTSPAVFQLIPHQASARFLDENLKPMKVDLYDADTWIKYGWGPMADPKFLSKLEDAAVLAMDNPEVKPVKRDENASNEDRILSRTTYAQVFAYFEAALKRAKAFHQALNAPAKKTPLQLYAYGGNCADTLDAIVLLKDAKKDRWVTLYDARDIKTSTGKEIKKDQVKAAMFAIGDGRVTKRSLLAESGTAPDIKAAFPVTLSFFSCGSHFRLFLEKPIQDSFLSALIVETQKQP